MDVSFQHLTPWALFFEAVHQVKIERISIPHFVRKNDPSFLDSTRFISQINNIHVPLLMLCPSSTYSSISFIFPSTVDVSSVCSLIDRTEIKINICTIPTLHPLVSIRSSLLRSVLTIPHPTIPPGTSPFRMTEQRWASEMRDEAWKGKDSFLPQDFSSEQFNGDTYHCTVLCFSCLFFMWD